MPTIEQLRAKARENAKQLESVLWAKASDLSIRWGVDVETVHGIPRHELPYIEFGKSNARRYDPRDVEAYEGSHKQPIEGAA
jgi:hypothetical protein